MVLATALVAGGALGLRVADASAVSCADTYTPSSGTTGDWSTAASWSTGIPSSSTVVCWASNVTVTVSTGTAAADSIQGGGSLVVSGGTLTLADASDATSLGGLSLTGGSLQGDSPIALTGDFAWSGGGHLGGGGSNAISINQTGGGTFAITGTGQNYFTGGSITTTSNVSITDTNFIAVGYPTLTTTGTTTFASGTYSANGGQNLTITAAGFITTGGSSQTAALGNYNLHLTGNASSLGANLSAPQFSSDASTQLTIPSGLTLSTAGGTISGTVTGAGTLLSTGTTTLASGATLSTANLSIASGTFSAALGSNFTVGAGSGTGTSINSGTLEIAPTNATTQDLNLTGGSLQGPTSGSPGALTVTGDFAWSGGGHLGGGGSNAISINQTGGGTFAITGTGQNYFTGGSITTTSNVSITDTNFIAVGYPTLTTTGTTTFASGTYSANGGQNLTITAAGFITTGTTSLPNYDLVQTAGTTTVAGGDSLTPGAAFALQGGTLQDDGTIGVGVNLTGGTLTGTGNITGTVINTSGTVAPGDSPGTLSLTGDYDQGSGATLQIAVTGTGSGQSSMLHVGGNISLAGTLLMAPTSAYASTAANGDTFTVIAFASHQTGTFSTVSSTIPLADSAHFSEQDAAGAVNAVVGGGTPPPTNTTPPSISGTPAVGSGLTCAPGSWTGGPTFSYTWSLNGSPISGATSSTYTVQAADAGGTITCTVKATNASGSLSKTSSGMSIPAAPTSTANPSVGGTPAVGSTLTCAPGTWTGSPTFTYAWSLNGTPISRATSSTYTVGSGDAGGTLTCTVTASTGGGTASKTSPGVSVPAPVGAPTPEGSPSVSGTPLPGHTLTCDPGTWTGTPSFTYQWDRGQNPVTGATTRTYAVTILDEGQAITCVVEARTAAGTNSASSAAVVVAQKGTLQCPKPSGTLTTRRIGPLSLGETRTSARRTLKRFAVTHYGFDDFCLFGGWGIRGAYKRNRIVLLLTANPFYTLKSVSVGLPIAAAAKHLHIGKAIVIGLNHWYVATGAGANYVLKVRRGVIQEIGIANKHDTRTHKQQRAFLSSFRA